MKCAILRAYSVMFVLCGVACMVSCVWCLSACSVHRPNGTRARNAPSRIAPIPLRNRQIAFGYGRFPVRRISHRCVPQWGRWAARLARARGRYRAAVTTRGCLRTLRVRLRRIFPPKASLSSAHSRLPVRLGMRASSAHERHPARSEYLPSPPAAPVRRCAHPAARARSGPVPAARPLAR